MKWLRATGQDEESEIDTDLMRRFLAQKEGWDPEHVKTVKFIKIEHETRGVMVHVSMAPMHKNRVVIPLATPFVMAKVANTQPEQIAKWAKVPVAMAERMGLGAALDMTGTDTSRLFYFPRHARNMPWEITICGGALFDWRTLELDNPYEKLAQEVGGSGKTKTPEGQALCKWASKHAAGFQIVDVLEVECPDKIRGKASAGVDIECPFDGGHHNAGDPDDRACFAVNAGEGTTDWFVVSCRHDSCRDYTMLDMLGRMIADGWFPKSVLEDENYNAVVGDGDAAPTTDTGKPEPKVAKEKYQSAIDALTPDSSDEEVEEAVCLCLDVGLGLPSMESALKAIAKNRDISLTVVRKVHKICAKDMRGDKDGKEKEDHGLDLYTYNNDFNFDDAVKKCVRVLKKANEDAKLPMFCQFNSNPVRLDVRDGHAEFVDMSVQALWSELNNRIAFVRKSDTAESARQMVPKEVAQQVWEQAYENLPRAPEVIHTPIYLRDGSLLLGGKYHFAPDDQDAPRNHLLLLNDLEIPEVPKHPTKADAEAALNWLRDELLCDFPFCDEVDNADKREPSEANALAMLLAHFMRPMIAGRTPVFAITKPQEGSGATFLAQTAINLWEGFENEHAPLNYTKDEKEMVNNIVAAIKEARAAMFFDDVKEFNNRVLLRATTAKRVGGRLLGQSRIFEAENNFMWLVTGNAPVMGREMRRRVCWIRLNPKTPVGEERTYRHDLNAFLRENRGVAIGHLLTLIEYWQEQGAPEFKERGLSGFDDWARKVGGVLMACGVEGFLANKTTLVIDPESATEDEFLSDVLAECGVGGNATLPDLFKWADGMNHAFVTGRTPDERRQNFDAHVIALAGRTFKVEGVTYILRAKQTDSGVAFKIEEIKETA